MFIMFRGRNGQYKEHGVSIISKIYVHLEKSNYLYTVICLYRFWSLFLDIYSTLVYIVLIQMGVRDVTNSSRVEHFVYFETFMSTNWYKNTYKL